MPQPRAPTIAATPPGANSDCVLNAILPDLVEGATTGWLCQDPDGVNVVVHVDVSFFIGDYVQVSKTSKLMGHGAKSPCPLCHYRAPGVSGSKYGLESSSADITMARTTSRTHHVCRAVTDAIQAERENMQE